MQGWVYGLCCSWMLLLYWKNFTLSCWWGRETLVRFSLYLWKEKYVLFCFYILLRIWASNAWLLLENRVERIFREINNSIQEGSLVITLFLKKLPVVLSRFTALTGLLVNFPMCPLKQKGRKMGKWKVKNFDSWRWGEWGREGKGMGTNGYKKKLIFVFCCAFIDVIVGTTWHTNYVSWPCPSLNSLLAFWAS